MTTKQIAQHDTQSIKATLVKSGAPKKGLERMAGRIAQIAQARLLSTADTQELAIFIADRRPQLATVDGFLAKGYYVSRIVQAYEVRDAFRSSSPTGKNLSLGVILELLDCFGDAEDTEYFVELMTQIGEVDSDFWRALRIARGHGLCYLSDLTN